MSVVPSTAYVTITSVTNLIRAICNDMLFSQAGELITDTSNYMLPLLNDALEWMQSELANHGVTTFEKETILTPLTPTPNPESVDPATQVYVSDEGYFDGSGINLGPQLQVPTDLQVPLRLWERQTGSTEDYIQMTECPDGLPSSTPSDRFRLWEWRNDFLYMPGAVQSNDIRLRYVSFLPQFVSVDDTLYIRGGTGPLAYKMASVWLASKNPAASTALGGEAMKRLSQIATRNSRMGQRKPVFRRDYGRPGRSGPRFQPPINS